MVYSIKKEIDSLIRSKIYKKEDDVIVDTLTEKKDVMLYLRGGRWKE